MAHPVAPNDESQLNAVLDRVRSLERIRKSGIVHKLLHLPPRRTAGLAAYSRIGRSPWRATTVFGARMLVTPPDLPSTCIARYGYFEADVLALLGFALKPGSVFVDVGAHVGFFSLWAASIVGPAGSVFAIEATPRTAALLRRNLAGTTVPTRVLECAVFDRVGVLEFADLGPAKAGFNGPVATTSGGARSARPSDHVSILSVDCCPLDELMRSASQVDCIKIDTEGSEIQVLRGAKTVLAKHRPHVLIETGDFSNPGRTRAVLNLLLDLGDYVPLEAAQDLCLRKHSIKDAYGYGNLLLAPTERIPRERFA